jgi:hypothetical protein
VFFRVFFGVLGFWHVWQLIPGVKGRYIDPDFHFKYYGFGWVDPLPGQLMGVVFLVMAASAIFIALGLFYRAAAATFFLLHTYVFLIDVAGYWNHYYLISLLAFLMIFVPAHRAYSLDVLRGAESYSDEAPAWGLWLLRAQMGIVYFYAGLAKLTSSDWLHGHPMDAYLGNHPEFPLLGAWFDEGWLTDFASYAGMLFDLSIVPLLLWPRTRLLGVVLAVGFHLSNSLIFDIEVFPWLAVVATLLFLPPSWPRFAGQWSRLTPELTPARPSRPATTRAARRAARHREPTLSPDLGRRAVVAVLGVFFLFQLLIPLRQFVYPGDASWTSEGHLFSWRMLIANRQGSITFLLTNRGAEGSCEVNTRSYLYAYQRAWLYNPDNMIQFAHHVAGEYRKRGADVEVNVWAAVVLNGREARLLADPEVDLATVDRTLGHHDWLLDVDGPPVTQRLAAPPCPDPEPLQQVEPGNQFD